MKKLAAWVLLVCLLGGCTGGGRFISLTAREAQEMMLREGQNYQIVDVRTPEEYAVAHIKGAVCVPNESIGEEAIPLLPDKEQILFLYCRSGNRSKQAAGKLLRLGYTRVYEMGGFADWEGEITVGSETP